MFFRNGTYILLACSLAASVNVAVAQRAPGSAPPGSRGPVGSGVPNNPLPSNSGAPSVPPSSQPHTGQGATAPAGARFGPPGRWWDDGSIRRTVGLSTTQQKKMDSIFDSNKAAIVSSYQDLMAEQAKLDVLNRQPNVDQKTLFAQIDLVNNVRSRLQKATSEMLLQLRAQLDQKQLEKLQNVK